MASEWKNERLSTLCAEIADCPHSTPLWMDSGALVLRSQNIRNGRLDLSATSYTDEAHFEQRSRRARLRGGDLVITREAPMGEVCLIPDGLRCCLGQRMVMLRPDPTKCDSRFLLYSIQSRAVQDEIKVNEGTGSTVSNLRIPLLEALPICHPPLAEQKAIAAVLGALDDKIELNRRMNTTLEAMARALFQSWFVDFDPVRVKLDGRSPADLDPATAALFPEHLEETALGHTPKGWEVRSLDKTAHYLNGLALQKYPPGDGSTLPVIKIAQLRKGDSIGADRCNTGLPPNYIVQDGDVLFSWSGSLEVELWCGGPGALNQHLFKVTSPEFPKWFYYLWTLYHLDEFRLIAADKATTMGHIQRGHLTAAKVLIPPRPLIDAMTRTMSPLIDQLIANRIQSRTLATLRDTLLPKLLSGELSVAAATCKADLQVPPGAKKP
ncbi:MAG: restriction endonuclease subunit S [Xanthomonadaceae bacterium]|nr:restriction endonuclease subunit S [Xanthomonadaceae bacterium]MDP2184257.1 restriction endonuclease subunit S [Xanthomonadales bacterium]MDZ4114803.1 restriction endonuclease subunit S [Xanthomonadaceae bacterium]MDZ4377410.1 restriction endonuclease subunit S [Xanthomonadaceae bacterium]